MYNVYHAAWYNAKFSFTFALLLVDERHAARVELGQLPLRLLVHLLQLLGRLDVVGREEQLQIRRRRTNYDGAIQI